MRVLVTGGAGRLGIRVCETGLKHGFQVRIFDVETPKTRAALGGLSGKAEIVWGDITRPVDIGRALKDVEAVVHMAAVLTATTVVNPDLATHVNLGGTRLLVQALQSSGRHIPFIYTSSVAVFGPTPDATEPLCPERVTPHPKGIYAETKLAAEELIRAAGIDFVILRLGSHWQDQIFSRAELRYMFRIPLDNRIETSHPDDTALAIIKAIKYFDSMNGRTLVISSGPRGRMLHRERVRAILDILGLPLPPAERFSRQPAPMDWYDTTKSEQILHYQTRTFSDSLLDYRAALSRRYSPLFVPLMRYLVGPRLGRWIVRWI
ncbi:MAG: NAD(P)-dependent oxidoreductase [Chloroflexi bacterium]|nr:NAD(P)-dependent oxidoreductase [Chloroflexota bacterium]